MIQLLIAGMRRPYLTACEDAWGTYHPDLHAAHIQYHDDDHLGMAQAIGTAWQQALEWDDWDHLLFCEEDMILERPLPLDQAVTVLESDPGLAQMLFQRQPWNALEEQTGSVLGAIRELATEYHPHRTWASHNHIFSLNPCLIPRRIIELGWPAGNEAQMTQQLLEAGYLFGCWGTPHSPPLVQHVGVERGEGWKL